MSEPLPVDDLLTIGRWIEQQRKARKWSRPVLAARAGVAENTVYLMEMGANTRMTSMLAVVSALDGHLRLVAARADVDLAFGIAAQQLQDKHS